MWYKISLSAGNIILIIVIIDTVDAQSSCFAPRIGVIRLEVGEGEWCQFMMASLWTSVLFLKILLLRLKKENWGKRFDILRRWCIDTNSISLRCNGNDQTDVGWYETLLDVNAHWTYRPSTYDLASFSRKFLKQWKKVPIIYVSNLRLIEIDAQHLDSLVEFPSLWTKW